MNIVLLGFMGVGKTSVGKKLALRLGYRHIDTDYYIEREENAKIASLFEKYGEKYFRELETNLLKSLVGAQNTVISTGGGVITTPGNMDIIRKIGKSVYLQSGLKDIYIKLRRNIASRPLLRVQNLEETVEKLFQERSHLYEQADVSVKVTSFRKGIVVSKIIRAL